jgi:hypothetical protein
MPINNSITPTGRGIPTTTTVTIDNGASLSGAVNLSGWTLIAIDMPASWTAANLTLQASIDNSTWDNVFDSLGTEVTITAAASRFILLNPADFVSVRYLKVRSGTSGTPVNQGGARTITLIVRAI